MAAKGSREGNRSERGRAGVTGVGIVPTTYGLLVSDHHAFPGFPMPCGSSSGAGVQVTVRDSQLL